MGTGRKDLEYIRSFMRSSCYEQLSRTETRECCVRACVNIAKLTPGKINVSFVDAKEYSFMMSSRSLMCLFA